jgi:Flp pilus assembly protein TadG
MRAVRSRERGTSLAEFALVAPVVLVLLVGMAQLGAILYTWVTVDSAVREGVRVASQQPNNSQAYVAGLAAVAPTTCGYPTIPANPACSAVYASSGLLDGHTFTVVIRPQSPSAALVPAGCVPTAVPDGYVQVSVSDDVPIFVPFLDQMLASPGKTVRTVTSTVMNRVEPCTMTKGQ